MEHSNNMDFQYFIENGIQRKHQMIYQSSNVYEHVQGYKLASDIIFKSMNIEKEGLYRDEIIYPILLLYVNILELMLKISIEKLIDHKNGGCPYFKDATLPESFKKKHLNSSHDLNKLLGYLSCFLKTYGEEDLHYFNTNDLSEIITIFKQNGIDTYSTRYKTDKKGKRYGLHENTKGVDIFLLNKKFTQVISDLEDYIFGYRFMYCECKRYDIENIKILKKSLMLMKRYIDDCIDNNINVNNTSEYDDEPWDLVNLSLDGLNELENKVNLINKSYSQEELNYILKGYTIGMNLYTKISIRPDNNEICIHKLTEKIPQMEEATHELEKHISHLCVYAK